MGIASAPDPPKARTHIDIVDVGENTQDSNPSAAPSHLATRGRKRKKKKSQTLILGLNGRSPRLNRIPKVSSLDRRVLVLSWQQPGGTGTRPARTRVWSSSVARPAGT